MPILTWEYYTGYSTFKVTKKGGLFTQGEGHWTLSLDKEFSLAEGLNYMGQNGWELIATQKTWEAYGGTGGGSYYPSYLYIFKKPKG
jgi:hypothetical protein